PDRFPCLALAAYALEQKGNSACIINAANEIAVAAFLRDAISFPAIYETIARTLEAVPYIPSPSYSDYVDTNAEARVIAEEIVAGF
ncbi:MAG: 1-deoxy-D-xylulose-5-phosphate reductoisomerase, partial [Muribaculaceae bacterium]|nr:1-deoxy-D-xylulose-5-phosphate reductoisomerase [Muribaculaceae bacterium]